MQQTIDQYNRQDIIIVMGDLNAKVGQDNGYEKIMGTQGLGARNDNGERCEFSKINGLIITCTLFAHKDIHKAMGISRWNGEKTDQPPYD